MRRTLLVLVILAVPVFLAADDVYLRNGRVLEDVGTVVEGASVRIFLPFGEIGFSLAAVERIEKFESSHSLYARQRDELRADMGASAADWVDLARWSQRRGFDHGAREAALAAARLDPQVAGLPALMAEFGFVFSGEYGQWVPFEDSMRLKGYELVAGRWMSAEQRQARALEFGAAERAREAAESRRLTHAVLALAAAQLAQKAEPEPPQAVVYGLPLYWGPPPPAWHNPFVPGTHGPRASQRGSDRPVNQIKVQASGPSHRGSMGSTHGGAVGVSSHGSP